MSRPPETPRAKRKQATAQARLIAACTNHIGNAADRDLMSKKTDEQMVSALCDRFNFNRRAMNDLRSLTTRLEATNRKLQESEAMKSSFLSNIRNEINNPLAAILGMAEHLAAGKVAADQVGEIGKVLCAEAFELEFQLENIFLAAELEAGQALPHMTLTDLGAILQETIARMQKRAEERSITIDYSASDDLHFATDPRMLQQMARNLVANAIEYSEPGTSVLIIAESVDAILRIRVRDFGPGIAPELRQMIFDRFRQLDAGRTKGHRGQGLGLSVTQALAELLGGHVALECPPDGGSLFTLTLPMGEVPADAQAIGGNFYLFDN